MYFLNTSENVKVKFPPSRNVTSYEEDATYMEPVEDI